MRVFLKLNDAIRYCENVSDLAVFSKEIGLGGQRHFLVSTRDQFWEIYQNLSVKKHYEVILPGKPCKLYFDLEYMLYLNKNKDGSKMTDALVDLVSRSLFQEFGIVVNLAEVIILDSTTKEKFSKHLIFRSIFERYHLVLKLQGFPKYCTNLDLLNIFTMHKETPHLIFFFFGSEICETHTLKFCHYGVLNT